MKKKSFNFRNFIFLLLAFFSSCYDDGGTGPEEKLKLNLFTVPDGVYSVNHQLKATIQAEEDLHLAFFGSGGKINSFFVTDELAKTQSVVLLDDFGAPAFMYGINSQTGEKEEGLIEFEPISPGSFFIRIYHYDWIQRIGTLIVEGKVVKSGGNWNTETTFVTANKNLDGVKARTGVKGGSFYAPIPRLDLLNLRQNTILQTEDFVAEFGDFIENFRKNDVPTFLREKVQPIGDIALVIGGVGVLLGSPAYVPILVGGVALSAATRANAFFVSGGLDRLLDNLQNLQNNISEGVNELVGGTVEVVSDYQVLARNYWNNLNLDPGLDISLEEILSDLEAKRIFNENTDLDDLPDSRGVIHIAMSWSTGGNDIDLWVTDPSGEKIYFENPKSASDGYLDLDDIDGFGPENIYWMNGAPDGKYSVAVHNYSCSENGCIPTTCYVKISNGLGTVRSFEGNLVNKDAVWNVVTFTKSGNNLIF